MESSLNIKTYLLYALYIMRTNPAIIYFLAGLGVLNGVIILFPQSPATEFIGSTTLLVTIFVSPVIYGIYYEKIEERYSSIPNIFRTYVAGYLLLLFCMYIPIIFATAMVTSSAELGGNAAYIMLTILIFSLLFIYVVPTYYISGKIVESIAFGVRFLFKNLMNSAPILLMAIMSELLLLVSHYQLGWLKEQLPIIFFVVDFVLYLSASLIDFTLFIVLIYILRNQNLPKRPVQPVK